MDFTMSEKQAYWRQRVIDFMTAHVHPAVPVFNQQMKDFGENRWQVVPIVEDLKKLCQGSRLAATCCRSIHRACRAPP